MKQETVTVSNGDRVLIQRTEKEREIVTVKAILKQGPILVRDSTGEIIQINQSQILNIFKT